jgi:hypothetical protein
MRALSRAHNFQGLGLTLDGMPEELEDRVNKDRENIWGGDKSEE